MSKFCLSIFWLYLLIFRINAKQRVPSMPKNVEVTQTNASSIRVSWEPPKNEGETSILGYNVYKERLFNVHKSYNNLHKAVASVDRDKLYTFIDDLEPNSEYIIRVAAVNEAGDGERSPAKRIVTGGRPPSAPRPQSIRLLSEDHPLQARIEWLPPLQTYNLPIQKYLLLYKPFDSQTFERFEIAPSERSFVLDDLYYGQLYELKLCALNEIGYGENVTEQFLTPEGVPDSEPLNIHYTISKNQLYILWNQPLWIHRNGNITHYRVVFKSVYGRNAGQIIEKNVTSQSVVFTIDGKTSYSFKVAAATAKGYGPYSSQLTINANINTSIGSPVNVRVQAVTNTSVVVQWDFDEVTNGGFADGFIVKYMHEPLPSSSNNYKSNGFRLNILAQEKWRTQPVMDSKARHLEIGRLTPQKSYAFCVLVIKQSRLGTCSDPPVTLDLLKPTYVVQNFHVLYKTSQSVSFQWEYNGLPSSQINFYIKQMGMKTYQDQFLEEKTLVSPGFEKKVNGFERQFLWQNLRPYMNYTFQVGVITLNDNQIYWPKELNVQTDPTGPPFVDHPEFIQSPSSTTAQIRLSCASEEYGPINHYWLIVVPSNYTKEDFVNVDSNQLQFSTSKLRALRIENKRVIKLNTRSKRASGLISQFSSIKSLDGVYITAQLSTYQMQRMYREERTFIVGDEKEYDGYLNMALDPNLKYSLMTRAFARDDTWRQSSHSFEHRPPMQEPASRLFTDSILTETFSTRLSIFSSVSEAGNVRAGSIVWLAGPIIVIFVIVAIISMLVAWWLRSNSNHKTVRGSPHGIVNNGIINKVALPSTEYNNGLSLNNSTINNNVIDGLPNENSKLLLGMDAEGRPIINSFECPAISSLTNSTNILNTYPVMDSSLTIGNSPLNNNLNLLHNGYMSGINGTNRQQNSVSIQQRTAYIAPIPLTEFATHIDKLKMNNCQLFIQEYESIETGQHFTWENSLLEKNKHKNRYANVVAYDHSRVILTPIDDSNGCIIEGSDYINANYIDGYDKPRAYIATQGPLPETFSDFWRMVWEERSTVIVMLTRLEERQRAKCDQYWPTRGTSLYGYFRVMLLETTELAHYCIRILRLEDTRAREFREIQHAQFTAWPDHGVPSHPTPFLMFLKRVKALNLTNTGPIVTHCSAGIGRTGAFIVIDCMLDRLRYEMTVDIYGCVKAVRAQRSYMVQTEDQYIFIHDAVLDAAQSGSTEVPSTRLAQHVQVLSRPQRQIDDATGMEIEFGTLITLKSTDSKFLTATLVINLSKNRQLNVLPYDLNRVKLNYGLDVEGSDYINASWIDGYRNRNAYIATQAPLTNTIADFWRMIWEQECCIIAMLTRLREPTGEKCCEYWPSQRREVHASLVVDCVSEFDMIHYILREFKLTHNETNKSRTVRQFQFIEWFDKEIPQSVERFVDYVRQVHQTKIQFGSNGPICVLCSDGAGRTGVFITASIVFERIKQEHVVDIFTTVKLLRMQRTNMVETREQYEFCYQAAIEFLSSFESPP